MLVAEGRLEKICLLMNEGNNSGIAYRGRFEVFSVFWPWSSQTAPDPRSPGVPL